MIAKLLVGVAIALGAAGWAAASANADPSPFNTLSCSCQEPAPPGSPVRADKINQGIRQGLAAPGAVN